MTESASTRVDNNLYIGIDAGAKGGMALITRRGLVCCPLGLPRVDYSTLRSYCENTEGKVYCLLEKVTGYVPKKGREEEEGNRQPGARMFNFGRSYGMMEGMLYALENLFTRSGGSKVSHFYKFHWDTVTPQQWQKAVGIRRRKDDTDTAWKNRIKMRARYLFPSVGMTLAVSDAVMIAQCCRLTYTPNKDEEAVRQ